MQNSLANGVTMTQLRLRKSAAALPALCVAGALGAAAEAAPVAADRDPYTCGPDIVAPIWPWLGAGKVRRSKERIFCYDIRTTTAYVAAPGGFVSDEVFAVTRQVNLSIATDRERTYYAFKGRRDGYFYSYSILDKKPPPASPIGLDKPVEIGGSVSRLAPRTAPADGLSTGFLCDREAKWCSLVVLGETSIISARFDAQSPDGNLCFRIAMPKAGPAEPRVTVKADGRPVVEDGAINNGHSSHCMGEKSADAIAQLLAAKQFTLDVANAQPGAASAAPRQTLTGQAKRLALLFGVTKFVYEQAIARQARPDAQPALKVQAHKLLEK